MKLYVITMSCDPYNASRKPAFTQSRKVIRRKGATPVEVVCDDYFGLGYSLEDARKILDDYYREERNKNWEGTERRRHFEMSWTEDTITYRIVPMDELVLEGE